MVKTTGQLIKDAREEKGRILGKKFTQQMLGDAVNVERETVAKWETGKTRISIEKLKEVATALDKKPQDFLGEEETSPELTKNILHRLSELEKQMAALKKQKNHE
jgi:transcriptional regulator with XRE-family HTH domain